MSLEHKLQWRYATKKFDPTKKVSEEEVTELLKAMNLSASSYGLQPFEFIVIHDQSLQDSLMPVSYNQPQVRDASHIIVIAAKINIDESYIDQYINRIATIRSQDKNDLEEYKKMMLNTIGSRPPQEQLAWSQRQCYIVLGTLLLAAADMKIDACPMEGFEPDAYDDLLGLKEKGLHTTVIIPIGYRAHDDEYQHVQKSRRDLDEIVELRYAE